MNKKLTILGAGGHGKVIAEIAGKNGYDSICFLDDDDRLSVCVGYPVVGHCADFEKYDGDYIVAIGDPVVRQRLQEQLVGAGKNVVTLIHPAAVVSDAVEIGRGTVIMAGCVINPEVTIGEGCIVNTSASIDHDCEIRGYGHVSVGTHLAGGVTVGERTWIGIGAIVSNDIEITSDCMIGAGSVVVHDIDESGIYAGVPAKKLR